MDGINDTLHLVKELLDDNALTEIERKIIKKLMLYVDLSIMGSCDKSEKIMGDVVDKIKLQLHENNGSRSKVLNDIFDKLRNIGSDVIALKGLTEAQGKEIAKIKKVAGINGGSN